MCFSLSSFSFSLSTLSDIFPLCQIINGHYSRASKQRARFSRGSVRAPRRYLAGLEIVVILINPMITPCALAGPLVYTLDDNLLRVYGKCAISRNNVLAVVFFFFKSPIVGYLLFVREISVTLQDRLNTRDYNELSYISTLRGQMSHLF